MSTCVDIREELKAYSDGELTGSLRGRVRQHVETCRECARELDAIQALGMRLKELDTAVPRPELRSRILSHVPLPDIQPVRRPKAWWRTPTFALGLGAAASAALLFALAAPFASNPDRELSALQQQLDAPAAAPQPSSEAAAPRPESTDKARTTDPSAAAAPGPSGKPTAALPITPPSPSASTPAPAPPSVDKMVVAADAGAKGRTPIAPGLASSVDKPVAPEGELARKPVEKSEELKLGGQVKAEAQEGATPKPSPPAQQAPAGPGGPVGGMAGGGRGALAAPADETTVAARLQPNRGNISLLQQNAQFGNVRAEALDVTVSDLESAANSILFYAQEEGARPVVPEKLAEPGADELSLTLLIPADKLEDVKARLGQYRSASFGRERKDLYSLGGAQLRQQPERVTRNQVNNRAFFGYVAPSEKEGLSREMNRQRDVKLQAQAGVEQRQVLGETDALKNKQTLPAPRSTAINAPAGRALKKVNDELVRLVIRLRTPPKQAPSTGKKPD